MYTRRLQVLEQCGVGPGAGQCRYDQIDREWHSLYKVFEWTTNGLLFVASMGDILVSFEGVIIQEAAKRGCFTGEVPLHTPAGLVPLANVEVGSMVLVAHEKVAGPEPALDGPLLRVEIEAQDGHRKEPVELTLLRPEDWVERLGLLPGAVMDIQLPELGVVGRGRVLSIEPTEFTSAPAGLVVAKLRRKAYDVYRLEFDSGAAVQVTGEHPLFSLSRGGVDLGRGTRSRRGARDFRGFR